MTLEDILIRDGLVSAEQLEVAAELARDRHRPVFSVLISEGYASEEAILRAAADVQGVQFARLKDLDIPIAAIDSLSARFVTHYKVMPIKHSAGQLTVALSSPFDMAAVEDIEANLGFQVERALACADDIAAAILRYYGVGAETVSRILDDLPDVEPEDRGTAAHDLERTAEDVSVVRLVDQLLHQAIRDRATDVHFEAYRDGVVVRRRIDGILYDTRVAEKTSVLYSAMVSRIKLMGRLNIVEKRLPQDGRARVTVGGAEYDLRISVIPAAHGENVVVRILPATMLMGLEALGFSPDATEIMTELISRPHGIVFVTGPTGSGKSTTLYACLKALNSTERKIVTIEDPVEYEIRGLSQLQVNPRIGLSFATALRSMLRHDPDVMMVGEVRDKETAEITVQTALTGHLVLSTLHTNSAASSPPRLLDMGVDPYLVASSVRAFTAQRLVRVICKTCKTSELSSGDTLYYGSGCDSCGETGYSGRAAICEIMPVTDRIQDLVMARASSADIERAAVEEGMIPLAKDGQAKIAAGITTRDEVLRVTSV